MSRHNEIAVLMGRVCHGEKTPDVMGAALVFMAHFFTQNYTGDDKEAAIDAFAEHLKEVVTDLDEGHGYKIKAGMQ